MNSTIQQVFQLFTEMAPGRRRLFRYLILLFGACLPGTAAAESLVGTPLGTVLISTDTVPEPAAAPLDQNLRQLQNRIEALERERREQALFQQEQRLEIKQKWQQRVREVQVGMLELERESQRLQENRFQQQRSLEQQEMELQKRALTLKRQRLELQEEKARLEKSVEAGESEALSLQQLLGKTKELEAAERTLEQERLRLGELAREQESRVESMRQQLSQKRTTQQFQYEKAQSNLEQRLKQFNQRAEGQQLALDKKIEDARQQYERLLQRRENMKQEGKHMRKRQLREEEEKQ